MAMIADVMREINNYFEYGYRDGRFTIEAGELTDDLCTAGQYIAISGSLFNDGVHLCGTDALTDEVFTGRVWYLHPPNDFTALCDEIAQFATETPVNALASESFNGYSYSRATGQNGAVLNWQTAFAERLRKFRRMFTEVDV